MNLGPYFKVLEKSSQTKSQNRIPLLDLQDQDYKAFDFTKLLHQDIKIRRSETEKLFHSNWPGKLRILLELMRTEPDLEMKSWIRTRLNELGDEPGLWGDSPVFEIIELQKLIDQKDFEGFRSLFVQIVKEKRHELIDYTLEMEKLCKESWLKKGNIRLMTFKGSSYGEKISNYLEDPDEDVVVQAIESLGLIATKEGLLRLFPLLVSKNVQIRSASKNALEILGADRILELVRIQIQSEQNEQIAYALEAIQIFSLHKASSCLMDLSRKHPNLIPKIRIVLSKIGVKFDEITPSSPVETISSDPSSFNILVRKIQETKDHGKLSRLLYDLSHSETPIMEKLKIFKPFLSHTDDRVRANTLEFMAPMVSQDKLRFFCRFLTDSNNRIRGNAILALCRNRQSFEEYKTEIISSLTSLCDDPRAVYQLTALYCIRILECQETLVLLLSLCKSPIEQVKTRANQILSLWMKENEKIRITVQQIRSHDLQIPSSPLELREWLDKHFSQSEEEVISFLQTLCVCAPLAPLGILLGEKIKTVSSNILLASLIDASSHHGLEDRFARLKNFLKTKNQDLLLSVFSALSQEMNPQGIQELERLIQSQNLSTGNYAKIVQKCMPELINKKPQLALRAMRNLCAGNEVCLEVFAQVLPLFQPPSEVLFKMTLEAILKILDPEVMKPCLSFLKNHLDKKNFLEKVEFALSKVRYESQRDCLKSFLQ